MNPDLLPLFGVAGLIALAGTFWFHTILKGWLLTQEKATRYGLYVLIWLAYFIAIVIIAGGQPS